MSDKITGRERLRDEAEAWLKENDPEYAEKRKEWQSSSTDALARDRRLHRTLRESTPVNPGKDDGSYRKYPKSSNHYVGHSFENDSAIESDVEGDE